MRLFSHIGFWQYHDYTLTAFAGGLALVAPDQAGGGATQFPPEPKPAVVRAPKITPSPVPPPDGITSADAAGATVTRHDYFPFGESTSPLTGDPRRFLGQERDAETAFDYLDARYYRNVWGRFTSVDPVVSAAVANPQRWNRYAYALNNPLRFVDPSGLDAEGGEFPIEDGDASGAPRIKGAPGLQARRGRT